MEHKNKQRKLSQFISLILRHKPEVIGITLDKNGWADVSELIAGIRDSGKEINMEILEEIVKTDNKGRYSFNDNKTKIRANQGHSISVDVGLQKLIPPDILYHGTASHTLESIKSTGVKSMKRLYVHLSKDIETAIKVGSRHGKPCVLEIDAKQMHDEGVAFYRSENGVWLTKYIDWKYVKNVHFNMA